MNKRRLVNIPKLNSLLLILLSFFYLQGYELLAYIMITMPLVFEAILILSGYHKLKMKKSIFIGFLIVIYTVFTQLFIMKNVECLSFLFSISYFVLVFSSISYLSKDEILKYTKMMFVFAAILLIIDASWRLLHPVYADFYTGIYWFYRYKGKGLFFIDTNNTGMLCLSVLCLMLYLDNSLGLKFKKLNFMYVCLLILTFSRAAIIAYLFLLLFFNRRTKKILKVLFFICAIAVVVVYIPRLFSDVSTGLKLGMISRAFSYWKNATAFEIFFGIGFTNSINKIGLFTHSWPLTFSLEFGFLGFLLMIFLWYFMYRESNKSARYILFPCLLAGLSFLPLLIPYVYSFIAIVMVLENKMRISNPHN